MYIIFMNIKYKKEEKSTKKTINYDQSFSRRHV